jgi:hypothetical protein
MKHKKGLYPDIKADRNLGQDDLNISGFIGYLRLNILIPHSRSLKDRRQVIERIKQRTRNRFNISVAEMPMNHRQKSELVFVCVNYKKNCLDSIIERIEDFLRLQEDVSIVEIEKKVF